MNCIISFASYMETVKSPLPLYTYLVINFCGSNMKEDHLSPFSNFFRSDLQNINYKLLSVTNYSRELHVQMYHSKFLQHTTTCTIALMLHNMKHIKQFLHKWESLQSVFHLFSQGQQKMDCGKQSSIKLNYTLLSFQYIKNC